MIAEGITLYLGQSFSGKTARMLYDISKEPRVVLVDAKCGELAKLSGWSHLWPVYDSERGIWFDAECVDFLRVVRTALRGFRLVVHFRAHHKENLELLCRLLPHVGNCILAIDEVSFFFPPGPMAPAITSVLMSGRHEGISVAGTAQRPSLVNINARSNVQRLFVFTMTEPADVDALRGTIPAEFREAVPLLPPQVCIDWELGCGVFADWSFVGKLGGVLPA